MHGFAPNLEQLVLSWDHGMKGKERKGNSSGPIIRRLRKSNDWTQKDFAKKLREAGWKDCDRVWISRLESGDTVVRDIDIPYLQAVLGDDFLSMLAEAFTTRAHAIRSESLIPLLFLIAAHAH